ncbi:MAG: FemAB family XrtA/PEP-CTERM system-associated protein [Alphaproteobacteria bacterium]
MKDAAIPPLAIKTLTAADRERWDAFVLACREATFFHRAGWQEAIEASFGHQTHYLYAERDGEICGVLPLIHVNSRLFGRSLVSTSFAVYGGPAAVDDEARAALDAKAIALAESLDVDHLEYRSRVPHRPDWAVKNDLYVTFRKAISADHDANMKAIPRKQRAMVRKGINGGLRSEIDESVDRLHHIYAASVRALGTPVFPKAYFAALKCIFGRDCDIVTIVTGDGQAIASVLNFYFRDEVLPYYGGGTEAARDHAGNDFMYWEVMRRAADRGYRLFDFGRSKQGTGAFSFKKNWGFVPEPLQYQYYLRRGDSLPEINPLNPKYRMAIAIWKRLPLPLTKLLGPTIVRNLG